MKPEQLFGLGMTIIGLLSGIVSIFTMGHIQDHFTTYWGFYGFGAGIVFGFWTWISSKFSAIQDRFEKMEKGIEDIANASFAFNKRLEKEIEFVANKNGTLNDLREFQRMIASNQDLIGNAKLPDTED